MTSIEINVSEPKTGMDFDQYYQFRWLMLRSPWQQPIGSEKDEFDEQATHRMILDDKENIIAIGRLHLIDNDTAQIRYMAVSPGYERQGLGSTILKSLERVAKDKQVTSIQLHARETAVPFYEKNEYKVISSSYLLYDEIQHFLMKKKIK